MPLPLLGAAAGGIGLGASGAASMAGTTAASGGIFPLLLGVYSLLQSLGIFDGDKDDEEQQRLDEEKILRELKPQRAYYQSPFLATADKTTLEAILAQLGRTANWGWPQGNNVNLPFLQSILNQGIGSAGGSPITRLSQGPALGLRDVIR